MEDWISLDEYQDYKHGDSVKRSDGAKNCKGNLFQVEGVIVEIVQWHKSDFVSFHVAVCGKLDRIACLQPDQVIKTDKKFILSENGQMSLF